MAGEDLPWAWGIRRAPCFVDSVGCRPAAPSPGRKRPCARQGGSNTTQHDSALPGLVQCSAPKQVGLESTSQNSRLLHCKRAIRRIENCGVRGLLVSRFFRTASAPGWPGGCRRRSSPGSGAAPAHSSALGAQAARSVRSTVSATTECRHTDTRVAEIGSLSSVSSSSVVVARMQHNQECSS